MVLGRGEGGGGGRCCSAAVKLVKAELSRGWAATLNSEVSHLGGRC
jgi:hypothetical protein